MSRRPSLRVLMVVFLCVLAGVTVSSALPDEVQAVDGCSLPHWDGDGTYQVRSAADLDWITDHDACWDDDFRLTRDIDVSAFSPWDPIGRFSSLEYFEGTFDGDNHTISGLTISDLCGFPRPHLSLGLFDALDGAQIHDVTISGEIDACNEGHVGLLSGFVRNSVIENATVSGEIDVENDFDGYPVTVLPRVDAGGMIGYLEDSVIESSTSQVNIVVESDDDGSLENDSLLSGVGGLIGYGYQSSIMDSAATGSVIGVGVGDSDAVDPDDGLGGPRQLTGGLAGVILDTEVLRSYSSGSITGSWMTGGFVGLTYDTVIEDSFATGDVVSEPRSDIGFTGGLIGSLQYSVLTRSFALGDVQGIEKVGGLIGSATTSTISATFSRGSVTSFYAAGLIADIACGAGGTLREEIVEDSYATGEVFADRLSDRSIDNGVGFVRTGCLDWSAERNFWDIEASNYSPIPSNDAFISPDAVGETTSAMKSKETYTSVGWDFDSIWCMRDSLNDGYPFLRTIRFGPYRSRGCYPSSSRGSRATRSVSLDPNGGSCIVGGVSTSEPSSVTFSGSFPLPTSEDCSRTGYVLRGWAQSADEIDDDSLIQSSISRSASLFAVWGELPRAPEGVVVMANFLCGPCDSAVLLWPVSEMRPEETWFVIVDEVEVVCSPFGTVFGFTFCFVDGLESGTSHVFGVGSRNRFGADVTRLPEVVLR